jgi:hypothetical protein
MLIDNSSLNLFRNLLKDCWERQGFNCPIYLTEYITMILATRIDQPNWQPHTTFAEQYLKIRTPIQALELGNTCFFARSVFPEMGSRRGISSEYYVELGQGCYGHVLSYNEQLPAIRTLHTNFEYCAEMTWTAVHSQGQFREFWDL